MEVRQEAVALLEEEDLPEVAELAVASKIK